MFLLEETDNLFDVGSELIPSEPRHDKVDCFHLLALHSRKSSPPILKYTQNSILIV